MDTLYPFLFRTTPSLSLYLFIYLSLCLSLSPFLLSTMSMLFNTWMKCGTCTQVDINIELVFVVIAENVEHLWLSEMIPNFHNWVPGWRVGSVVRALDWRSKCRGFESRQEHKKNFWVFPSQKGCAYSLSVCPTPVCIRTHTKDAVVHVRVWWIMETSK